MTPFAALQELLGDAAWVGFAVFLRCASAVSLLPGFGEQSVPVRVKLALSVAMTLAVAAGQPPAPPPPASPLALAGLCLGEVGIGLALGLGVRLFLLAMQTAGAIAAQATSLAQLSGGAFPDPLPGIGQILSLAALTLLMVTGFPERAVLYLYQSYSLFPIGALPAADQVAVWGMDQIGRCFALAFQLSAPFFLLSVAYNLVLGAINRAMPQLMVAFVGAPAITWASMALLLVASPVMLAVWQDQVMAYLNNPTGPR